MEEKRIFISWASKDGEEIASTMKDWLESIFMTEKCFVSSEDILKGGVGDAAIVNALNSACVGIFCLTQENRDRPWISYEAGYLAGKLNGEGVITILFDFDKLPPESPLVRHQYSVHKQGKKEYLKIVTSINSNLGGKIPKEHLNRTFDSQWNKFQKKINPIVKRIQSQTTDNKKPFLDDLSEIHVSPPEGPTNAPALVKKYYGINNSSPDLPAGKSTIMTKMVSPDTPNWVGVGVSKDIADGYEDLPQELREARKLRDQFMAGEEEQKRKEKRELIYAINHSYVDVEFLENRVTFNKIIFAKGAKTFCDITSALEFKKAGKVKINFDIKLGS